ncbi:MAG: sirohydrochlorin chelatase [Alphaproteobacteria bacterium]|jgi:sirohydrochlorin cobaltochelatase|nr:sirohydrochlorin chelatase [Alphaproteobacteria bacterium]
MATSSGVILCGHGTRNADGIAEFVTVAEAVQRRLPHLAVRRAFLEWSAPRLDAALDGFHHDGVRSIAVVPGMLFAAGHSKTDIPAALGHWQKAHPSVTLHYGRPLGVDPRMLEAAADRVDQALEAAGEPIPRADSLLLVVGRGSSDPDANADLAKVMRLLWEGLGFGWGLVGYFDVTFPRVDLALDQAGRMGARRVVVLPYLLFTGVLIGRLQEQVAAAASRHPDVGFVTAPWLGAHPGVVATFADRALEAVDGDPAMNCRLCKYRTGILAFDGDVGAPQAGGADPGRAKSRHPFADHPLGPAGAR